MTIGAMVAQLEKLSDLTQENQTSGTTLAGRFLSLTLDIRRDGFLLAHTEARRSTTISGACPESSKSR